MKKKDKHIAGMLALFFGWLGVHRYYLGQNNRGLVYTLVSGFVLWAARVPPIGFILKFLWFPLIVVISLIDAITLFAMEKRLFDERYNGIPRHSEKRNANSERPKPQYQKEREPFRRRQQYHPPKKKPVKRTAPRMNPYKKSGVEKFSDYDYVGAIADFKKSIEISPNDIASHFNLACAYSLTEDADNSFYHLDTAVRLGFKDFNKIKNHHALAYLRIQPAFDDFEENGFRSPEPKTSAQTEKEDLLSTKPDLLDQLNKLGELRKKGLLTEMEFQQQKQKLLG